jgi:hypothetical protein
MSNEAVNQKKEAASPGLVNYYVGLAIDIILLYALNNIRYLNSSILIKDEYVSCLWAINLALGMGIIGNFILLQACRDTPHLRRQAHGTGHLLHEARNCHAARPGLPAAQP